MIDYSRTETDAGRFARAHAADDDWPELSELGAECDECQDTGWVNYGCSRDPDCPGGDCCDRRCRCEAGRAA